VCFVAFCVDSLFLFILILKKNIYFLFSAHLITYLFLLQAFVHFNSFSSLLHIHRFPYYISLHLHISFSLPYCLYHKLQFLHIPSTNSQNTPATTSITPNISTPKTYISTFTTPYISPSSICICLPTILLFLHSLHHQHCFHLQTPLPRTSDHNNTTQSPATFSINSRTIQRCNQIHLLLSQDHLQYIAYPDIHPISIFQLPRTAKLQRPLVPLPANSKSPSCMHKRPCFIHKLHPSSQPRNLASPFPQNLPPLHTKTAFSYHHFNPSLCILNISLSSSSPLKTKYTTLSYPATASYCQHLHLSHIINLQPTVYTTLSVPNTFLLNIITPFTTNCLHIYQASASSQPCYSFRPPILLHPNKYYTVLQHLQPHPSTILQLHTVNPNSPSTTPNCLPTFQTQHLCH